MVHVFLKEDFIRKSAKTTLLYTYKIYTCMYIPPPATYPNTIHNTKLIDIKHLSNGQLSRKVVQLMYVGCPRLMQIY